jgi:hypothetical protein
MIKKILFILAIFLLQKGYSQFLVLPQEQVRADYFYTLLPQIEDNIFQFLVGRDHNNLTSFKEPNQILKYNFSGQFLDSINLPKGFFPISFPLKFNQFYYWSALYMDTTAVISNVQDAYVLKFDHNFNCLSKKRINSTINNPDDYPSNIIESNNKLYVTVNSITNYCKLYKLDTLLNKLDSVIFNGANAIEIQKNTTNQIVIAGYNFPPLDAWGSSGGSQKIILDTNLSIINSFVLDSLTFVTAGGSVVTGCSSQVGVSSIYSFKILPITSTKNFVLGRYDVVYNSSCAYRLNMVHSIVDVNNHVLNTTLIADSSRGVSYVDNTNFTDFKDNYLYSVGSVGQSFQLGIIQPQNTAIIVCKSDTMANLIWKKRFGDDMYYRPVSIITTLDSGLIVSGIRYNDAETSYPGVGQSFILKLDKLGNQVYVGIKEINQENFSTFKCFPNPTKDAIYFDVPFSNSINLIIYDVFGRIVYENKDYTNLKAINTEFLNTGTYAFKLITKQNQFSGKFIKE